MSAVVVGITEVFSWVGLGLGVVLGIVALIARLFDGVWGPVTAYIVGEADDRHLRWFDDASGAVAEAPLTDEIRAASGRRDEVDVFVSESHPGRARLQRQSSWPRFLGIASLGAFGLAIVAWVVQLGFVWAQTL